MKWVARIMVVVMLITLLISADRVQTRVEELREKENLTYNPALENAPPEIALTSTLLGSLRGVAVFWLWLRSIKLQEEGRFFELVQLGNWICKLEPRLPSVWIFQAWNMAYNISYEVPTGKERWRWILAGITLLRDQGIPYNQKEPKLYKELCWIYLHKVGGTSDDQQYYYKKEMALSMESILGVKPDINGLCAVPSHKESLLKEPKIKSLLAIFAAEGVDLEKDLEQIETNPEAFTPQAQTLLIQENLQPALKRFRDFRRRKRLYKEWRLEPEFMKMLAKKYGPLDWRHPACHAIYWMEKGLIACNTVKLKHTLFYKRMIRYCLQQIYRQGRITRIHDPKSGHTEFQFSSDYRFLDAIRENHRKMYGTYKDINGSITPAYCNFLDEAVRIFYQNGQTAKAQEYFDELKSVRNNSETKNRSLASYVAYLVRRDLKDPSRPVLKATISAYIDQSYYWMAIGDPDKASGFLAIARTMHSDWQKTYGKGRLALPSFADMVKESRDATLKRLPPFLVKRLQERL